jgi:acyl dehydratase
MALNYDALMAFEPIILTHSYSARDTMLYALGIGAGADDPVDPAALRFVYEDGLQALPTMAVVLAYPGPWLAHPQYRADYSKVLHGEQFLTVHKPLPATGSVIGTTRVEAVYDKGEGKGAVVYHCRDICDAQDGSLLVSLKSSSFLRADGGFGGPSEGAPKPHPVPDRPSDLQIALPTRIDQGLLYRLSGDYNPLHADPAVARAAGFDRPILHGLCTYGVIGRGVIGALCDGDAARLKTYNVRFSAPVMPGETLDVEIWREGDGRAALRASVRERGVTAINNGLAEFA